MAIRSRQTAALTVCLQRQCNATRRRPGIDTAQAALLRFVQKVTDNSHEIIPADVETLRNVGWSDLQIAEAVHLAALFACFNRVASAFGLPSQHLLGTSGPMR